MSRPDGGLLGVATGPTPLSAKGAWNLRDVYQSRRQAAWPITSIADPFYARTSLLLNCEGANNSTTVTDSSPNAFTATVSGNAKISTAQYKFGSASLYFNGGSDRISYGGQNAFAFGSQDFVIEMWIYPTSISSVNQLVDFRGSGESTAQPKPDLALVSGKLVWYINNAIRIQGSTTLTANAWYHVALARSGTSTRMYLGGSQEGSTWTDTTFYTIGTSRPMFSSNGAVVGTEQFLGYMDDIRITRGTDRGYNGSTITVPTATFLAIG